MENWKAIDRQVTEELWAKDRQRYFKECLKIQDEHGHVVPLELNKNQRQVQEKIDAQKKAGVPVRIIILKGRKAGTSTLGEAELFHAVRFHPADALVVAHDVATTEYLFSITQRFYANLDKADQLALEASNRRELHFSRRADGREGGRILIATAGTKTAGRGFTPLYLHCSEPPYYENAEEVMLALLNSVPSTPESMVILEGTANMAGGWFYEQYWKAKRGASAFEAIFVCWKDLEKYALRVPDPDRFHLI